jgi:stage IV sporulation protein B
VLPLGHKKNETLGIILCIFVVAIVSSSSFRTAFSFPDAISVAAGELFAIDTGFPVVSVYSPRASSVERHPIGNLPTKVVFDAEEPGSFPVEFRLFGLIPIRRVSLVVEEPVMVMPGGHSIGVILRSHGLVVTGLAPVESIDGRQAWPAKNAGIEAGDVIISVSDQKVKSREQLSVLVDAAGRSGSWLSVLVEKPDGSMVSKVLMPVQHKDGGFRIGLVVRDSLAGVGTLTFYEENSRLYAALGHLISEGDSRRPLIMKEGHIVRSTIAGVQPSKKGQPGEFLGMFVEDHDEIGNIIKNGPCGISGILNTSLVNPFYSEAIPLGLPNQVVKGPAEILTTVSDRRIERFSIEIESVFSGAGVSSKGFTVRITDPKLLSLTGGIVQGMSGSPVIQNGRLIGAITHVLVNDPTRGYGTFALWMAQEAYIVPDSGYTSYKAAVKILEEQE